MEKFLFANMKVISNALKFHKVGDVSPLRMCGKIFRATALNIEHNTNHHLISISADLLDGHKSDDFVPLLNQLADFVDHLIETPHDLSYWVTDVERVLRLMFLLNNHAVLRPLDNDVTKVLTGGYNISLLEEFNNGNKLTVEDVQAVLYETMDCNSARKHFKEKHIKNLRELCRKVIPLNKILNTTHDLLYLVGYFDNVVEKGDQKILTMQAFLIATHDESKHNKVISKLFEES